MGDSPRRTWLYRSAGLGVTLGLAALLTSGAWAQFAKKSKVSAGPRAVGLIQLAANDKGRLVPVAIMVDGKFFDAAAYKATPVPMALDFGIVYEGFRTGVSQGIFTITQPGRFGRNWLAEGTWLPAGAKPPQQHLKADMPVIEDKDAPPKLHRKSNPSAEPSEPPKPTPAQPAPAPAPAAAPEKASAQPSAPATIEDADRPLLRRGKPDPNARHEPVKIFQDLPTPAAKDSAANPIQFIPAISDSGGPDARPYNYEMSADEEASYRKKMLDLATMEIRRASSQPAAQASAGHKASPRGKLSQPEIVDVRLRVFDLSSANEPVLVLSATVRPLAAADSLPQEITLVARTNLELELHKLFFSATDSKHLDVTPRMELIDAVDADGDSRGELLFRRISDSGSAYAIYRATADRLWPLYEPAP